MSYLIKGNINTCPKQLTRFWGGLICKEAFGKCKLLKINHSMGQFALTWTFFSFFMTSYILAVLQRLSEVKPFSKKPPPLLELLNLFFKGCVFLLDIWVCMWYFFLIVDDKYLEGRNVLDIVFYSSLQIAHHNNFEFII